MTIYFICKQEIWGIDLFLKGDNNLSYCILLNAARRMNFVVIGPFNILEVYPLVKNVMRWKM